MLKEQCLQIGSLIKPHGVHGELVLECNAPEVVENIKESVFLEIEGLLVPFFIQEIKSLTVQRFRIKFLWCNSEKKAKNLVELPVYLHSRDVSLSETGFADSPNLLLGFKVKEVTIGDIGTITDFIDNPSNPIVVIEKNKKELLIPIHTHFIMGIQPQNKLLILKLPEGLIEL